jgi:hypothetical protein
MVNVQYKCEIRYKFGETTTYVEVSKMTCSPLDKASGSAVVASILELLCWSELPCTIESWFASVFCRIFFEEYASEVNMLYIKSLFTPAVTSYNFVSLLLSSGTGETMALASS